MTLLPTLLRLGLLLVIVLAAAWLVLGLARRLARPVPARQPAVEGEGR